MLVSIIIPIYNSGNFLKKLLNNLVNQTYKNIEIILIDDGSEDNSLQICNEYQVNDKRIKVISQTNKGVSSARNKGLKIATGDYITFIDSDDDIDRNYIDVMVRNIEDDYLIKTNTKNAKKDVLVSSEQYLFDILSGKIPGVCWGYLFRKDLLKNIKFDLNTSFMEDTIFLIQYLINTSNVKVLKEKLYYHEVNQDGLTNSNKLEKKINEYMYSIDKIQEILRSNNIVENFYEKSIDNKRIKLIESELAKAKEIEEIQKIILNKNVVKLQKIRNIDIKYKLFMKILKTKNEKTILLYIKFRRIIKKLVKGN